MSHHKDFKMKYLILSIALSGCVTTPVYTASDACQEDCTLARNECYDRHVAPDTPLTTDCFAGYNACLHSCPTGSKVVGARSFLGFEF